MRKEYHEKKLKTAKAVAFVEHIEGHLEQMERERPASSLKVVDTISDKTIDQITDEPLKVLCKICGKNIDQIHEESQRAGKQ